MLAQGSDRLLPSTEISAEAFDFRCAIWSTISVNDSPALRKVVQFFVAKSRLYKDYMTITRFEEIVVWSTSEFYKQRDLHTVTCIIDQQLGCSARISALHKQAADSGDEITGKLFLTYAYRSIFGTPNAQQTVEVHATATANHNVLLLATRTCKFLLCIMWTATATARRT